MLTLMLDPRFKSLRVVENYVGHGACIHFIIEYDANEVIPFLMTMFDVATPLWPSVRMKLTLPKLGTWSPLGLPNL